MDFYKLDEYLRLEKFLLDQEKLRTNSIIITLPGLGVSYFLNKFFEKNKKTKIGQITSSKENVLDCNIVELDSWVKSPQANLKIVDNLLQNNFKKRTFIVMIPTPSILNQPYFKNSYLASHVYETYFLGTYINPKIIKYFAEDLKIKQNEDIYQKVFELSGGIPILIKYLLLNTERLGLAIKDLIEDQSFLNNVFVLIKQISKTNKDDLEKLNIINKDKFKSTILDFYFKSHPLTEIIDIEINNDLSFTEDGIFLNPNKLTKVESVVINKFIENNGFLSKEDVANIKWGKNSYDEYSDQAVGKTLQRLGSKLKKYRIDVIFKHGFKIIKV